MSDSPVNLSVNGPPETVLDEEPAAAREQLNAALSLPADQQREAIGRVVAAYPTYLDAWAQFGRRAENPVDAYAAFRVGYHRGLDRLRGSGWRGSGYVRWIHESNRGFLRALDGLRAAATHIGEEDEAVRCHQFLLMCDPDWDRLDNIDRTELVFP